ncbi:MAG: alginate export family protein [Bryobacteraceae bacterium]|nr:alginate export family protein [Bryobacteraceae bacterium]
MKMKHGGLLAAILVMTRATACMGQTAASPGYNGPGTLKAGGVTVTGNLRLRTYGWDWFEPASGGNTYGYGGSLLRVSFAQSRKRLDWNVELAAPFLLGLPTAATAAAPQGALGLGSNYYTANDNRRFAGMVFPKQAFLKFKGLGSYEASSLQVGRFEFNEGTELIPKNASLAVLKASRISQRLIGSFGWTDVGRSFDGGRYSWTKGQTDVTVVGALPTRGVFQTDGWGWNKSAFGYAALTRGWGGTKHAADSRVFFIEYTDWRQGVLKTDNRAAAIRRGDLSNIRVETFGAHSLHSVTTSGGAIDLLGWVALQTGEWGVQKHRAYAVDAEAGFQPKVLPRVKPWLRGGFTASSGDGNAADGTHGTFFQVLPTPRPYARTPFFNMMNIHDAFGSLVLRPHAKVTLSTEFHSLRLANAQDLWYSGGGAFQPWTFGYAGRPTSGKRSLANLYDTSVEFRANKYTTLTGYFGYAQGLAAMRQIYPAGKNLMFGYLEALIRF